MTNSHFELSKAPYIIPSIEPRVRAARSIRTLKGRNKALLVPASNGRYYVQKFLNRERSESDRLFNEAFGSQLGIALGLSFPAWAELWTDDERHLADAIVVEKRKPSSFGSELIQGDVLEYLPGKWFHNVENRAESYRCLLFDLWCNHTDSRQTIFQPKVSRVFRAYFFDHDQMFSPDIGVSLPKRIAQTRCLDQRIYEAPLIPLASDLLKFAGRIRSLVDNELSNLLKTIPESWGSRSHRDRTITGLERRIHDLNAYVEGIVHFADSLAQQSGSISKQKRYMICEPNLGVLNIC